MAALNTGNNLLFFVVSAMLAAHMHSQQSHRAACCLARAPGTRGLSVPVHVFAPTRAALARLTLPQSPPGARPRSPWVSVSTPAPKEGRPGCGSGASRVVFSVFRFAGAAMVPLARPAGPGPGARLASTPAIFGAPVWVPCLAAGTITTAEMELRCERHGRYQQESFSASPPASFFPS